LVFTFIIIAVCSQSHTEHTNAMCGQNVEYINVESGLWRAKCNNLRYKLPAVCPRIEKKNEGRQRTIT